MRSLLALGLTTLALALPAAAGKVWTVAPSGGDFTQIQPAVDAALDGDLVLVRAGAYSQFAVVDKSVTVVAQAPGVVQVSGQVRVQDLAAGRSVALLDLNVTGNGERALYLANSQGSIRVRGGAWQGTSFVPWFNFNNHGIEIQACADVALYGLQVTGGQGMDAGGQSIPPSGGGDGIRSLGSSLAVYHCTVAGGDGGGDFVGEAYDGENGGHGLFVDGGYVHVTKSTFTGGDGGHGGDEDGFPPFVSPAGRGGHGGDGMRLVDGAGSAHGDLLAATGIGGAAGTGGAGFWGPPGAPGTPGVALLVLGSSTATDLGSVVRRLNVAPKLTAGGTTTIQVHGQPGEAVALILSKRTQFVPAPASLGVWLLGGLPIAVHLGQLGPGGSLSVDWKVPALAASVDGRTLHLQALLSDGSGRFLSGPATTAILQPGF